MKFLILGAGPSGLAFAHRARQLGIDDILLLEAEQSAGGLCRSVMADGAPFDIGGGHFLDTKDQDVCDFLFAFLPREEWNQFSRNSQICINNQMIHHPMEANIWEFDIEEQVKYLKSIAQAECNQCGRGGVKPERFTEWITWKLGNRIAEHYMLPYNMKLFGEDLNQLGIYWLDKLPDVSFEDTVRSCLEKKAYARQPGHAEFYYPKKYGYGEVWQRMAKALGERIQYGRKVKSMDIYHHTVVTQDGCAYKADIIVTTIPWVRIQGLPMEIQEMTAKLKHVSVQTDYYEDELDTDAQWIYDPDLKKSYHRVLVRHNFFDNAKGYWTETNAARIVMNSKKSSCQYLNEFAYPLNTADKPEIMRRVLAFCEAEDVYGLGRWGEHQHYNSDVSVKRAVCLADKLCTR